jgi:hypothetical protein
MEIRPAGSSVPPTSALDALRRVQSSAAADDSEESQTAGYRFGDARPQQGQGEETEESDSPNSDQVDISPEAMERHEVPGLQASPPADPARDVEVNSVDFTERHIDIEA